MKKKTKASMGHYKFAAFSGAAVMMLAAVSAVMVVSAYLSAQTQVMHNEFQAREITYTNIGVNEAEQDFTFNTTGNVTISNKKATIQNPAGNDRKPVYVRAAVTCSVQNANGLDVTTDYPCVLNTLTLGTDWVRKDDGYYYYQKILIPGSGADSETTDLFGGQGVTFTQPSALPTDYKVIINVIGDAIQAVDTDSVHWTDKDYYKDESIANVTNAWGKTPTPAGTEATATGTKSAVAVTSWSGDDWPTE